MFVLARVFFYDLRVCDFLLGFFFHRIQTPIQKSPVRIQIRVRNVTVVPFLVVRLKIGNIFRRFLHQTVWSIVPRIIVVVKNKRVTDGRLIVS